MIQTLLDNRYTCSKPLGSGGMAEVHLAHDEVLDRNVALKVLKDQYAGNEEFVRLFRREARSAARLYHPNTVSVYDQGRSEDGTYYMAMGTSLAASLRIVYSAKAY
jgi:eukaryotic-like serine/threonine-protein kinase